MDIVTRITSYSQIQPGSLYTNGREVRKVKYIDAPPLRLKANYRMDWQGALHRKKGKQDGVAHTTVEAFKKWVNNKPKNLPNVVWSNVINQDGMWSPFEPVRCVWNSGEGLWLEPGQEEYTTSVLGLVRVNGEYIFTSESKAEVEAWMRGVKSAFEVLASFSNRNHWGYMYDHMK